MKEWIYIKKQTYMDNNEKTITSGDIPKMKCVDVIELYR